MSNKQPERVSYSFGMKLSLPTKYESADFHISLGSDVQPGETSVDAFNRVKREVETYVALTYQQIRNSEEGLTTSETKTQNTQNKLGNTGDAPTSTASEAAPAPVADIKILQKKIKQAFGVLEAQKKITKSEFVSKYLKGKRTDDLNNIEVTRVIVDLREAFPELSI